MRGLFADSPLVVCLLSTETVPQIMNWLTDPVAWSALAALLALDVVLGVDNLQEDYFSTSKQPKKSTANGRGKKGNRITPGRQPVGSAD